MEVRITQLSLPMSLDSLKKEFVGGATSCLDDFRSVLRHHGLDPSERQKYMMDAGKQLQAVRLKLFKQNAESSMCFCTQKLQKLWNDKFSIIRNTPELILGGKRA